MLVSHGWICEIAGFTPDASDLANRLTFGGLEVDALRRLGEGLEGVVVGKVISREPHPVRERLHCAAVDSGEGIVPVVCGAPNCPGPGGLVALAKAGTRLGGTVIEARDLAGSRSEGMLCSELELGIGPDHEGIILLDGETDAPAGTPLVEALRLDDWIYDLSVTPNRPDALSHRGIAREACLLYGAPYAPPAADRAVEGGPPAGDLVRVTLADPDGCPRYACAVMRGVKAARSPFGVRYRLHSLGVRPISNLVDVTNLVLLEWGQPLHAFDLAAIHGREIVVRKAKAGETMRTLDEVERILAPEDLLICDGAGPVAIAGVMGGLETGVRDATTDVLIECAYFDPKGIRRTSKRLRLASESSYRFERGIDPNMAEAVLDSTCGLIAKLAGGVRAPGAVDRYPRRIPRRLVALRPSRFERVMGYRADEAEMALILEGIGAAVAAKDGILEVSVPTARPDIEREIDLVEEVARIAGLERIPSALPRIQSRLPDRAEFEMARRTRETLAALGLDEAITYSFVPRAMLEQLGAAAGAVQIANPLNSERASMRTTLLAGLLESLKRASTRYEATFRQFEVGRVFRDAGGELPEEELRAAAVMSGPRDAWVGEELGRVDYYDAKGIAGAFVREIAGVAAVFEPVADVPCLHPRRASRILVGDRQVGVLGEIHPSILAANKLGRGAVAFEIGIDPLWDARARASAAPLSDFPPVTRDIAFLVAEEQDAGPMEEALRRECGELAVEVRVFDVYRGKGIDDGKKSLAFSITYRSWERTLTDEEVDALHRAAASKVETEFGARVR